MNPSGENQVMDAQARIEFPKTKNHRAQSSNYLLVPMGSTWWIKELHGGPYKFRRSIINAFKHMIKFWSFEF